MATLTISNHHEFRPKLEIKAKNPVYENRMYVSGFLGFISTTYKKEMISCDGDEEIWTCAFCGEPHEHECHKPRIIRMDRFTN